MRIHLVQRARWVLLGVIVLCVVAGIALSWQNARAGHGPGWLRRLAGPPQVLAGRHIGIVAGHSGNDSGTVCIDGLTEASVNRSIADLVVHELTLYGATADSLLEFDERLLGYQADVFVSIHADSCQASKDMSGFKVASLEGGSEESGALAACLWKSYAPATGLAPDPDTVTRDMTDYHSFREIAASTPAAIIETGFLNADRSLLTKQPDRAAQGIVDSIRCFLVPADGQ
jgi:N-acetylmuramoyl-L-alanine amidase